MMVHTPPGVNHDAALAELVDALGLLVEPGAVVELRALRVSTSSYRKPHTVAGYYDGSHLTDLAREALKLERVAAGVYVTLNPLKPDVLARRRNRVEPAQADESAHDADVLRRRWLLIDADPKR